MIRTASISRWTITWLSSVLVYSEMLDSSGSSDVRFDAAMQKPFTRTDISVAVQKTLSGYQESALTAGLTT